MTAKKIYSTFLLCCLMSTSLSISWEIERKNGDKEICCFCRPGDRRNHFIPECQERFRKQNYQKYAKILGYTGPPYCSCVSKKYPACPSNVDVCGLKVHCPNYKVYNSCDVTEFLTKRTMKCNDDLQWEQDFTCDETCTSSFEIVNGIAQCERIGNQTVCKCTCNVGYKTSQTENLSCTEAKATVCSQTCPSNVDVCGLNVHCPNNRIYNNCDITELLPKMTMKCNEDLQWKHDITCDETCTSSFKIKNGSAQCERIGNQIVCKCTCNVDYKTSQTENLSCTEAKATVCSQKVAPARLKPWIIITAIIAGIALMVISVIIGCVIYKKYHRSKSPHTAVVQEDIQMVDIPNSPVPNSPVPNSPVPNSPTAGFPTAVQDSNLPPEEPGSTSTLDVPVSDRPPEEEDSNNTPGEHSSTSTLAIRDINNTSEDDEGHQSLGYPINDNGPSSLDCPSTDLLYAGGLSSMGIPSIADSLPFIPREVDGLETPPKTFYSDESESEEIDPLLSPQNKDSHIHISIQETDQQGDIHLPIQESGKSV